MTATHEFSIRTITTDGIFVAEETDFAEEARFDFFTTVVACAEPGEIVQLLRGDNIEAEEFTS